MLYWWLGRRTWWIKGGRLYSMAVILCFEGDQFKVNMGEKKLISNIDIEIYLTLLDNI